VDYLRYYLVPATTSVGVLGFLLGGNAVWLGAATFPALLLFDLLLPEDTAARRVSKGLLADVPLYLHAVLMVALYAAFLRSVIVGSNPLSGPGSGAQIVGTILSLTWLSAVPTLPVAHELMHRRHWLPRRVAQLLNTFYGDPNRDIGHVRTHHIHLDTHKDSDTPLRGESMYRFVLRASWGAYKDAIELEAARLRKMGRSPWHWSNRNYEEVILLAAIPLVCYAFAGAGAAIIAVVTLVYTKLLLEGFNYFQHYGLVRAEGAPIQKHHAWNHLGAIARPLGVEITNHIHHHLDSYTRFYALPPEPNAPRMPSLFLCFLAGLVPPIWYRFIAKPLLKDWDLRFASPVERKLAMAENARAGWPMWVEDAGLDAGVRPSAA
jgi:toluene methyl-monooxygenase